MVIEDTVSDCDQKTHEITLLEAGQYQFNLDFDNRYADLALYIFNDDYDYICDDKFEGKDEECFFDFSEPQVLQVRIDEFGCWGAEDTDYTLTFEKI